MNKSEDLYLVLGVSSRASSQQIRLAYRKLARKLHPDHNPDDPDAAQRFSHLTEAYRILSDPQKRQAYDTFRKSEGSFVDAKQQAGTSFGAFFKKLFGSDGPAPQDGRDLKTNVTVTLSELVRGTRMHVEIPSTRPCSTCNGLGTDEGDNHSACRDCKGSGYEPWLNKLEVGIPAGLDDGTKLKISGEGEAGLRGGKNGDLFVEVKVKPHPVLSRKGRDLSCRVPVALGIALLGGDVEVAGLEKSLRLKIPAGTVSGKVMRLRGQGLPPSGGGKRGSLLVTVMVEMPTKLNKKQRLEISKVFNSLSEDNYPEVKRFAKMLKSLFG